MDIVIVSVPGCLTRLPLSAPALLKGAVTHAGFACKTIDYNIRFYQDVIDPKELETYFVGAGNAELQAVATTLIETWVNEIISLNPRYIGISVFTYQNRVATQLFCEQIRKLSDIKIVIGGQGLYDGGINGEQSTFAMELHRNNQIDYWIRSDGEVSLVELLKGNDKFDGINSNSFEQNIDLNSIPFSDYDDYDFSAYDERKLIVTGSRGCVRECSFCDVHEHWDYTYKSGERIAEEMLYLSKKYGVNNFIFSDSLVNGNLKEFKIFTKIIAEHNRTAITPITWSGQFIIRQNTQVSEDYWQNIAASGANRLAMGIETGSDKVRLHMNKRFNNADVEYTMSMLVKYKISCLIMIIVGYPTETERDFQDTLDMFTKYKELANKTIVDVSVGSSLSILPGTPLERDAAQYNIELDNHENNWIAWDNPELTIRRRIERVRELIEHLVALGYVFNKDLFAHMYKILDDKLGVFEARAKVKKMIRLKAVK